MASKTRAKDYDYEEIDIDWQGLFPFAASQKGKIAKGGRTQPPKERSFLQMKLQKYEKKAKDLKEKVSSRIEDNMPFLKGFSFVYCSFWKLAGFKRVLSNDLGDIYILPEGYLTFCTLKKNNAEYASNKMKEFQQYLEDRGIDFLYIKSPFKFSTKFSTSHFEHSSGKHFYRGYIDYTQENANNLAEKMKEKKINFLDFDEKIREQGLNKNDLFFKNDHHWTPKAGLWAAMQTAQTLNLEYGFDIDISLFDEKNFSFISFPKSYLGSLGKKTTTAFVSPEDFSYCIPKGKTDFFVEIPSIRREMQGDFQETVFDKNILKKAKDLYGFAPYNLFCYGTKPIFHIKNNLIEEKSANDKKCLIICDSFAHVFTPYLSLAMKEIVALDPRMFSGSLKSFIAKYHPDIVFMLLCDGTYTGDENTHSVFCNFE